MKRIYRNFLIFVWIPLFLLFFFTMTHKFVVIAGDSMDPTLKDGDVITASAVISPEIGDIYMIKEPEEGYYVVKRLVGVPGDLVELRDGALYRNDVLLMPAVEGAWDNAVYSLGADEYLFMGDNRSVSYDGRHWPRYIHMNEILYHLDYAFYPLSRFGKVGG